MKYKMRTEIAREAAKLLYYKLVRDYKQAKNEAASNLKVKTIPSNFEVAIELDTFSDEVEGDDRERLIVDLRKEALIVLRLLKGHKPRLIGSVWRGTARKGSDIDIEVFSSDPQTVIEVITNHYQNSTVKDILKTDIGMTQRFLHIYFQLPSKYKVEIVVKSLERIKERRTCEIYGDIIVGLTPPQLAKILEENPNQSFVPQKR